MVKYTIILLKNQRKEVLKYMCKIYAVASQKGGVAKSSKVLNLATALGMMGKKVLAVDLDPQGSLSICSGVENPDSLTHTTYSLLNAALNEDELPEQSEYIVPREKMDVIPCNITLSALLSCILQGLF